MSVQGLTVRLIRNHCRIVRRSGERLPPPWTRRQEGGLPGGSTDPSLKAMNASERITIEPGKRSGKPCIRGLRITVDDVLSYLASGMTEAEILADFPDLEHDDFLAVYAFAADRERRLLADPAA